MEIRNSKTEMPLFVKGEKFIFVGEKTIMKLSDMCIMFEDGDWIESKDQSDDGIRLLQTGNIGEGKFLEKEGKERFISRETFEKLKCKEVFSGDILISRLPEPVGRACLVPEKKQRMITAVDCTICRIDDKKIRRRYLCYYLQSANYYTQLKNSITGTTRKRISRKNLGNIEIKIPSDKKQEEVIKQLDLIVEIIDNKKKKLQLLDTLVKSRFVELFGDPYVNPLKWKRLKIKDAVTIEPQNGLYKPQSDYVADGTGTPILRIDGFYNGRVTDFGSLKRLKCSGMEQQRYLLLEDDIVINRVNSIEYLGKCAHIKGLLEDTVYESNMMRMHFDPEHYNPVYICKLLCSQYIYDQIVNHAKKAVNQASINQKDVLDFNIYQPPLELQNQFADFVASVDKSKSKIQKSLEETQLLFDSLMQKYFG